ncbi:MAG: hypothetical protein ACI9OU_000006 [Candidatus Promineifilaceae bacterium]
MRSVRQKIPRKFQGKIPRDRPSGKKIPRDRPSGKKFQGTGHQEKILTIFPEMTSPHFYMDVSGCAFYPLPDEKG